MLATSVIRRLIREEKIHEINASIEMCKSEGMQTMEQSLAELVESNLVIQEEALSKSSVPAKLQHLLQHKQDEKAFEYSDEQIEPRPIFGQKMGGRRQSSWPGAEFNTKFDNSNW
jgi:Tfp pilus assembly ATPase PilU